MTARTYNGERQKLTTARAKYRDLSTSRRAMRLPAASVEMTFSLGGCGYASFGVLLTAEKRRENTGSIRGAG
jgi:hypothetical protein